MRKARWNINLILLFGGEMHAGPLPKARRTDADVHGDVEGFTFDDATELRLRMSQLIMQTAKSSLVRNGVVVLNEEVFDTEVGELGLMIGLAKRTARVAMDYLAQLINTRKGGLDCSIGYDSISRLLAHWTKLRRLVRFSRAVLGPECAIACKEVSRLS